MRAIRWILSPGYDDRLDFERDHPGFFEGYDPNDLDDAWMSLRDSFDSLFDFFERLVYLHRNNRITKKELHYFDYFIIAAKKEPAIKKFLDAWHYGWHNELEVDT